MKFIYSTPVQNLAVLRRRLRGARGVAACRICRWLLRNLTDAQLKNLFDVTAEQVAGLKARLQDKADKLLAVEDTTGE